MAEYIEREKAYEKCGWYNTVNGKSICAARKDELVAIPAADVAPVRHGRWIDLGDDYWERGRTSTRYKCSECGRRAGQKQAKLYHYCPNCGAKMEVDHETD